MSVTWPVPFRLICAACAGYAAVAALLSWTFTQWTGLSRWTMLPAGPQHTYLNLLGVNLATWLGWGLLAPAVFVLGRELPFQRGRWAWPLAGHAALSVALTGAHGMVVTTVRVGLQAASGLQPEWGPSVVEHFLRSVDLYVPVYWGLLGLQHAIDYGRAVHASDLRTAQVETRLVEAQLLALQRQLHPHFLFNTLHAISALVHSAPDRADQMLERLSDMLRATLRTSGDRLVPLGQELEFLRAYLDIEQANLGDRLHVTIDVHERWYGARVPPLLLQPLAENAVRHGVALRLTGGRVRVSATAAGESLVLTVADDGGGVGTGRAGGHGVGLVNARARLEALYGPAATLTLGPDPGGGTLVVVRLPLDMSTAPASAERQAS
ncbi:MAG: histidine kinase [Acidobacteria bacterium]|nr:histidine kinase [Acidobacteriota bacterium]